MVKNPPSSAGDVRDAGLIPGGGNSKPLQHSCLGIPWTEEPGEPNMESCLWDTTERLSTAQPVNNVVIVSSEQ